MHASSKILWVIHSWNLTEKLIDMCIDYITYFCGDYVMNVEANLKNH